MPYLRTCGSFKSAKKNLCTLIHKLQIRKTQIRYMGPQSPTCAEGPQI
jgi:hypothetical protein